MMDIDEVIENFVEKCRKIVKENTAPLDYDLEIGGGRKYTKIIMDTGNQKSVWCFIDRKTGDILKPANWNRPAKHSRGNLYDDYGGMLNIHWTGPAYMGKGLKDWT